MRGNSCQEVDSAFVIAGGDGAELLEFGEEILDEVTRFGTIPCRRLAAAYDWPGG
jgi:hypothetical protein